jgi:hypothetical protein
MLAMVRRVLGLTFLRLSAERADTSRLARFRAQESGNDEMDTSIVPPYDKNEILTCSIVLRSPHHDHDLNVI